MPTINQLTAVDAVTGADAIPLYSSAQGDARRASATTLAGFMATAMSDMTTDNITASEWIKTTASTVAGLPAGTTGARAFVTDATAATFASIVAGGGANNVPVYHDGTNWRIG